jgi:hypothetical protein
MFYNHYTDILAQSYPPELPGAEAPGYETAPDKSGLPAYRLSAGIPAETLTFYQRSPFQGALLIASGFNRRGVEIEICVVNL